MRGCARFERGGPEIEGSECGMCFLDLVVRLNWAFLIFLLYSCMWSTGRLSVAWRDFCCSHCPCGVEIDR